MAEGVECHLKRGRALTKLGANTGAAVSVDCGFGLDNLQSNGNELSTSGPSTTTIQYVVTYTNCRTFCSSIGNSDSWYEHSEVHGPRTDLERPRVPHATAAGDAAIPTLSPCSCPISPSYQIKVWISLGTTPRHVTLTRPLDAILPLFSWPTASTGIGDPSYNRFSGPTQRGMLGARAQPSCEGHPSQFAGILCRRAVYRLARFVSSPACAAYGSTLCSIQDRSRLLYMHAGG
ncbi:hypothetical protein K461DRAFT_12260 [Myriangium duriaei CBS 260.36]|uniref:Uncharacterized protein n=1 Tax=Myriangium duriaei CBS 260.36 TaxID=1168546 RepID=A0A9P4J8V3_9PEZI|nr:hypothetical protein K461DRAFT_12260 [Myriangium duriaei CBS 260.36]